MKGVDGTELPGKKFRGRPWLKGFDFVKYCLEPRWRRAVSVDDANRLVHEWGA